MFSYTLKLKRYDGKVESLCRKVQCDEKVKNLKKKKLEIHSLAARLPDEPQAQAPAMRGRAVASVCGARYTVAW